MERTLMLQQIKNPRHLGIVFTSVVSMTYGIGEMIGKVIG